MYKVILIDDEETITEGLRRVIRWQDYDCEVIATAYDAKSASAAIHEHHPDIIFTDIRMGEISGLTMLAGLKADFPNMQITVLTAYRDFAFAQTAINLGVTRYLLKPSKLSELQAALEAMIGKLQALKANRVDTQQAEEQEEATTEQAATANHFVIHAATEYISNHYMEKLTAADVADNIFVSRWYLSKLLNKYSEKSFNEILNETRIEKAKVMLENPKLQIQEISEMVGYADVAYFSKIFRKYEDMSPTDYRNTRT